MNSDLEAISLSVPSLCQPLDMMGGNAESGSGAGTLWQDPSICKSANPGVISLPADTLLTTGKCKSRAVTVAYVRNSETSQHLSPENMALQCLKDACDVVGCKLDVVPFGKLDFGETSVLDHFYNAGKSAERVLQCALLTQHKVERSNAWCIWFLSFSLVSILFSSAHLFQERSQNDGIIKPAAQGGAQLNGNDVFHSSLKLKRLICSKTS